MWIMIHIDLKFMHISRQYVVMCWCGVWMLSLYVGVEFGCQCRVLMLVWSLDVGYVSLMLYLC